MCGHIIAEEAEAVVGSNLIPHKSVLPSTLLWVMRVSVTMALAGLLSQGGPELGQGLTTSSCGQLCVRQSCASVSSVRAGVLMCHTCVAQTAIALYLDSMCVREMPLANFAVH